MKAQDSIYARAAVVAAIGLATLLVYLPLTSSDFVAFDDMTYVVDNPHVNKGLTPVGVAWAMTACHASNWHPVTWISHMIDVSLFGMSPGLHHGVNIVLHLASAIALFLMLGRITGAMVPSAVVAAVFAVHPLHVESVAWIAERKDVLSSLFGIAAIDAYCRYTTGHSRLFYAASVGLYALSLMSKPMLVTLPCLLVLLDYWPLRRLVLCSSHPAIPPPASARQGVALRRVIIEKAPFLALSAVSCVMTLFAQQRGGAVVSTDALSLTQRLANAAVAYVTYIVKAFCPVDLAVFYPHPGSVSLGLSLACVAVIGGVTALVLVYRHTLPQATVGWLWYLGTLVPVIGLVQVGAQSMADRYMYFPLIGLSIAIVWWAWEAAERKSWGRSGFVTVSLVCIAMLMPVARRQVLYWKDSETLFTHALDVTGENSKMLFCRGIGRANRGAWEGAIEDFTRAIKLAPDNAKAFVQRGVVHHNLGNSEKAIEDFTAALSINPEEAEAYNNRGNIWAARNAHERAIADLQRACTLKSSELFLNNLGVAYAKSEDHESAVRYYSEAMELAPAWSTCLLNRGQSYAAMKRYPEAIADFSRAIALTPRLSSALFQRGAVFDKMGERKRAEEDLKAAARLGNATAQEALRRNGLSW